MGHQERSPRQPDRSRVPRGLWREPASGMALHKPTQKEIQGETHLRNITLTVAAVIVFTASDTVPSLAHIGASYSRF